MILDMLTNLSKCQLPGFWNEYNNMKFYMRDEWMKILAHWLAYYYYQNCIEILAVRMMTEITPQS